MCHLLTPIHAPINNHNHTNMKVSALVVVCLWFILTVSSSAFVTNSRVRGVVTTTCLDAAAPKKKAKAKSKSKPTRPPPAAAAAAAAAAATTIKEETVRKAEFVSNIQEKTGLSKVDSEAALLAVLDTITDVRSCCSSCCWYSGCAHVCVTHTQSLHSHFCVFV